MNVTRRDFLKSTGALASAAALPSLLSCHSAQAAPSNRINLGIIGMGKMCMGHLQGLLGRPDVRVSALCDVESIRLAKAQKIVEDRYRDKLGKDYQGCDTYGDFRHLLDRPDIDAVLIATPTHWHAAQSILACQAGKDVYCEKPMTLSIHEGQAVIRAARHHHVVYQNGSQQRSDQKFRLACELVRNGRIGKVKTIFINNVGDPSGPCYLAAPPPPPQRPGAWRPYHAELCPFDNWEVFPAWRRYSDFDGGGMTDWGAHHFDIAQWALGMDDSGPVTIIPPRESEFKRLTYVYANGTQMVRGGAQPSEAGVEFVGENSRVCVNRGYLSTEPEDLIRTKWGINDVRLYESRSHFDNWFSCIRSREDCICTPEIGHRSSTVCHLGIICYRLNRTLHWDPVKEHFVNDPEADRLIHKPARAPWIV